jgi:hypothetical protein
MSFFDSFLNFKNNFSRKEIAALLIIVSLSSIAGIGIAYAIEKIFWNKNASATIEEPKKLANVKISNTASLSSSSIAVSSSSQRAKIIDKYGRKITYLLQKSGVNAGFVWETDIADLQQAIPFDHEFDEALDKEAPQQPKPLDEVIPTPEDCPDTAPYRSIKQQKNWLIYPKYNIEAPLQNGSFQDFYTSDSKTGEVNLSRPIEEDKGAIARGNYESVPVQRMLKNGIVRLPITPAPGQVGNSYIIGHTSNFPQVVSNYNTIFKPIERTSKVGEEFFIWDHRCRKMKFVVFESLAIREEDVDTAYKNFGDRRVVTLQGSILELVRGYLEPTKRWLTRGELVVEK